MARAERAYTDSYNFQSQSFYGTYRTAGSAAPHHRTDESERVERTRQRPQPNRETGTAASGQTLTIGALRQVVGIAVFVAVLLIGTLILNAYAANVQCSINELTKDNLALEDEIDALHMKIDSSTSIEQIESYAMKELNMRYPKSEQCIYISEDAVLMENFSQILRTKAYE